MNIVYNKMDIPKTCEVDKIVPKDNFYETGNANDNKIIKEYVKRVRWKYSLKESTININSYKDEDRDYEEIAILEIELKNKEKYKKVVEVVQKAIPYALILLIKYEDEVLLNVAYKRTNQTDPSKNTIEEFIYTKWIDTQNLSEKEIQFLKEINIKNLSYRNFYKFYKDFVDKINIFNSSKFSEVITDYENIDAEKIKEIINQIEIIEKQIIDIKSNIKKEKHFNQKMKMNIEIKKLEQNKLILIEKLQ